MSDYIFFGEAFRWSPTEIDRLGWLFRKEMKELYIEVKKKQIAEMKANIK